MKPSVSLIFIVLFAIQALNVSSTGSHLDALFAGEAPQDVPHQKTIQVLFNLPTIVTGFLEYQDTLHSISQLYQYYLNAKIFENLMFDFFRFMDVDKSGIVSSQEYQQAMIDAGISRVAADRVYGLASIDNPTRELGFGDFKVAMEMFFAESMSQVTFAYMTGGPAESENVGIPLETLTRGILEIFEQLDENYPQPGCDQLEYLFKEFDKDQDNKLNPEEFYHVLAIFLRYYKSGLNNVYYSKILHRDDVFTLLWERETTETSRVTRRQAIYSASSDYFLLAAFEKILNSVGHDIFQVIDANHNGVLELEEFKTLLAMFNAPESEALLLFTTADTDESGAVDYGEFLVTFETFVRRALSSLIFNLAQLNGQEINLEVCSQAWKGITNEHHVNIGLTDEAFEALFDLLDTNDDEVLDSTEFAEFTSTILTAIKKRLREDIDARISVVAGLNATTNTISEVYEERVDSPSNTNVSVAQGIVSRILSRVSVVQSEFATATTETTETTTTTLGGTSSTATVITTTNEDFDQADQKTFGFIDAGVTPGGTGFGFSLYDVVQESLLSVNMKEFPEVEKTNGGAAFGILLQGKLRNIGRPEL